MRRRDLYLKIEKLPGYSPVAPEPEEHMLYERDCMRGMGHEDGRIPPAETEQRRLDAVVYREYLDPGYTTLNPAKLVAADITEPNVTSRVPGTVIYTEPGERLFIHVLNDDDAPHSFHLHGLCYGIDSDGAWPFGVAAADGRRSDEICPQESWTYVFDATEETVGAWPFHDHCHDVKANVDRGLFGGIVVRDPSWQEADYEVPLFLHRMAGSRRVVLFDSGTLQPARGGQPGGTYSFTFPQEGEFSYFCRFHSMVGVVRVAMGGQTAATVTIRDNVFDPSDVTVGMGGVVTWQNTGINEHTATEAGAGTLPSYALNGRTFAGNTPIVVAESGRLIRWYVFNLDLEMTWHNFHLHGARWRWAGDVVDTRGLSPAESFVADTVVPPVVLLPDPDCEAAALKRREGGEPVAPPVSVSPAWSLARSPFTSRLSHAATGTGHTHPPSGGGHGEATHHGGSRGNESHGSGSGSGHSQPYSGEHGESSEHGDDGEYDDANKCVRVRGDFLIHCHVEPHMMQGMTGLVRAVQELDLRPDQIPEFEAKLGYQVPIEATLPDCPDIDPDRCRPVGGAGRWERLPDNDIFTVHAAMLHTGKVLLWSGTAEVGLPLASRLWDPATGTMTGQTYGEDLFCSGHAFLPDGRLCVGGGAATPGVGIPSTHLFDPATEQWTKVADMAQPRWYPTLLTLGDGSILAVSGRGGPTPEIFDGASWQQVAGAIRDFPELYPSLHLLPSGEVFYSRCGWNSSDLTQPATGYLRFTGPATGAWSPLGAQAFPDRQEGAAVIQIDDTVSPPAVRLFVFGGGYSGQANSQTGERIDMSALSPTPSWQRTTDMSTRRVNMNATLLPDGTILVVVGHRGAGRFGANDPVLETEIYDPVRDTWMLQPPMQFPRGYHSVSVLVPDGRVLTAGGPSGFDNQLNMEIFSPPYLFMGPRPTVTTAPAGAGYGNAISIATPDEPTVASVSLLRPAAITHHTDAGARHIRLAITGRGGGQIIARA
ncbi:MAG: multicopper oxidase domain-containing protein, partial [Lapillicoccus sp.]